MLEKSFIYALILLLLSSCSTKISKPPILSGIINPIVELERDTIINGTQVKGKIYLNSTQFYELAKYNGIQDYLKINYENIGYKFGQFANKPAMLKGDTGIFEFTTLVDTLEAGETVEMTFGTTMIFNFENNDRYLDSAYLDMFKYYVTQP